MDSPSWPRRPDAGPFALADGERYARWREAKLEAAPARIEELVVEVADPRHLSATEHAALLDRCRRANMAIYASDRGGDADSAIPIEFGRRFGLTRLDHNPGADDLGITALTVVEGSGYIPYSSRPISWHTDGYYNRSDRQILGLLLHCVVPSPEGGESGLIDHERLYIAMRDDHPEYVEALMAPDVMTIPGNMEDPRVMRPDRTGPVFWVDPATGTLQMRYTARRRNIRWKEEGVISEAVAWIRDQCARAPYRLRGTLQAGWGLLCNNVLHDRTGFADQADHRPRLLYRGRYYDRIEGTAMAPLTPR